MLSTTNLSEAIATIPDGASVAFTKFNPMAAARELVRQHCRNLHVIGVPTASFAVDLLVAAGCAASVETGAFVLGGHGAARNTVRATESAAVKLIESACPLIEMQLRAGASGVSFTPCPGLFGSNILEQRPDLKIITDPFDAQFDVVVAPALSPDIAIIHGLRCDADGNVVTTISNEERLLVQAARRAIATVEELRPDALDKLAPDEQVIPSLYFDSVVIAPNGMWPLACPGLYAEDTAEVQRYVTASKDGEAMAMYLKAFIASDGTRTEARSPHG